MSPALVFIGAGFVVVALLAYLAGRTRGYDVGRRHQASITSQKIVAHWDERRLEGFADLARPANQRLYEDSDDEDD